MVSMNDAGSQEKYVRAKSPQELLDYTWLLENEDNLLVYDFQMLKQHFQIFKLQMDLSQEQLLKESFINKTIFKIMNFKEELQRKQERDEEAKK
mmetsp:Transcript_5582/g.5096  ORF Transcript_5582/g.5096 Transcript_5582/m.5096 type:complete len:94 (-) Transcript_5582:40-321(-)